MPRQQATVPEEQSEGGTDLVVMQGVDALSIFTDEAQFRAFYERVKEETQSVETDVSTKAGRDKIRTMAMRVTRAKTSLDKAALALTEGWRQQTANVNAARRKMVEEMDALAKSVRAPLTEWEEAEKARVAAVEAKIEKMRVAGIVAVDDTSTTVRERGKVLWETVIDEDEFRDLTAKAQSTKLASIETLQRALERLTREEAEREELARLRREAAEREAAEALRRRQEELAAQEARLEEERKAATERAAREAEERAREEERRRAAEAEAERQRQHEEQLAEERRQREEAEAEARRERQRREAEEAQRAREAEEARRREADREHRKQVQGEAVAAIVGFGVKEAVAQKIVLAIVAGEIPAVTLSF